MSSMKRFYKQASSLKTDEGYTIQLDGKDAKTPSGILLIAPNKAVAEAVVSEWEAQEDTIDDESMPLTQILVTAIDRQRDRDDITNQLADHIHTDLLCYRTEEPQVLADKQAEVWDPWLVWFKDMFGTKLKTTTALEVVQQDPDLRSRIWNYAEALDEHYFAILHIVTSLSGSIILALAFLEFDIDADTLFEASELEEIYHADLAGSPDPVVEKRQKAMRRDLEASLQFMNLLDSE